MKNWEILGIEETKSVEEIHKAYIKKLRIFHPEEDPEGFKQLRRAYEEVMKEAQQESQESQAVDEWLDKVSCLYNDFHKRIQKKEWQGLLEDNICYELDSAEQAGKGLLVFLSTHYRLPHAVWQLLNEHFNWLEHRESLERYFAEEYIDFITTSIKYEGALDYTYFEEKKLETAVYDKWISLFYKLKWLISRKHYEEIQDVLQKMKSIDIIHPDFYILEIQYELCINHLSKAQDLLKELLQLTPNYSNALYLGADVYERLAAYSEAKKLYEQILEQNKEQLDASLGYARCELHLGAIKEAESIYNQLLKQHAHNTYLKIQYEKACPVLIEYYKKQCEIQSNHIAVKFKLAWLYEYIDQAELAKGVLQDLEIPDEYLNEYYDLMGKLSSKLGEYANAFAYYEKCVAGKGQFTKAYILEQKGLQLQKMKRYKEALKYYEGALSENNQMISVLIKKVNVLNKLGHYEDVIRICKEGLSYEQDVVPLYINLAEAYCRIKDYRNAISSSRASIRLYPGYICAYTIMMACYYELKEYHKVLNVYEEATALGIKQIDITYYRALALKKIGEIEKAQEVLVEAAKRWPDDARSYYELSLIFEMLGDTLKAIIYMNQAIKVNATADKYVIRASLYHKLGRLEEAMQDYDTIIKRYGQDAEVYNNKGIIYAEMNKIQSAYVCYQKALMIDANHETVNNNLGSLYYKQGKYEKALACYNKQLSLSKLSANYINRGWSYLGMGNIEKAIADFKVAMEEETDNAYIYYALGVGYSKLGKRDEAILHLNEAIKRDKHCLSAYLYLAKYFAKDGAYSEAIKCYTEVIKYDHQRIDAYIARAKVYTIEHKYNEALEDYNQVAYLLPKDEYIYNDIGYIYIKQGKYDEAKEQFVMALEQVPTDCIAHKGLIAVFKHKGHYQEAVAYYKQAIKKHPNVAYYYKDKAWAYTEQKKYIHAWIAYRSALKCFLKQSKENTLQIIDYYNIAECYRKLKRDKKASTYYAKVIDDVDKLQEDQFTLYKKSYYQLGKIYEKARKIEKAKYCYDQAKEK